MTKELLVIIPAYNEDMNIIGVLREVKEIIPEADILVVNDCSTDNTLSILEDNKVNYITTPFNLHYSGAIQTGFKYALGKGYKYAAQFDGDGQHIANELAKLFDCIKKENVDIVIGSRFIQKTSYKHPIFRRIGTDLFKRLIKITCGEKITDPTSGLQVLNRRVYQRYAGMSDYPDYPDANLIIEMLLLGYKIKEVPVLMRERIYGESMHSGIFEAFSYMIRMMYSILVILLKYKGIKNRQEEVNRND